MTPEAPIGAVAAPAMDTPGSMPVPACTPDLATPEDGVAVVRDLGDVPEGATLILYSCARCGTDCAEWRMTAAGLVCIGCLAADLEDALTRARKLRVELRAATWRQRSDQITLDGITAVCVHHGFDPDGDDDEATWLERELAAMQSVARREG